MQTPVRIVGRMLGAARLNQIIQLLKNEQTPLSVVRRIKFELGCKGTREGALNYAREALANIANW